MIGRISLTVACVALLAACAALKKPDIDAAYRSQPGPHRIVIENRLAVPFPQLNKELLMRVAFPEDEGSYPLIVLSHGNGCLQDLYTGFADHWATWGYVVIQPVHMDSRELGFSMKGANMEIMNEVISTRRDDVRFILDSIADIESRVPGLAGKIDADKLVAAGHSMGGGTAMMLTGVTMIDPRDGRVQSSDEDRFDALILISEPSNNKLMPNEPWRLAQVPTFIATGSKDFSTIGAPDGKKSPSAYQLPADAEQPDQPHYYLDIEGMDHYLGGRICRDDMPGPPDDDALTIINGASTAFLDAVTQDDQLAQEFLLSGDISGLTDGRAVLGLR